MMTLRSEYGNKENRVKGKRIREFIDIESGEQIKVHPNKIKSAYKSLLSRYHHELELKCAQYQIDLIDVDIADGYNEVLKSYLLKRNKMI